MGDVTGSDCFDGAEEPLPGFGRNWNVQGSSCFGSRYGILIIGIAGTPVDDMRVAGTGTVPTVSELDESASFWKRTRAGLAAWFHDCRAAVARKPEDVVRVRLILAPHDAASLYRALPPDTRLFVLPRS